MRERKYDTNRAALAYMLDGAVVVGHKAIPWCDAKLRLDERLVYSSTAIPSSFWVAQMGPGDTCFGGPGRIVGWKLGETEGSRIRVMYIDSWSIRKTDYQGMRDGLDEHIHNLKRAKIRPLMTSAETAIAALSSSLKGQDLKLKGLPPQFHGIAQGALHAGPMTHVRGGCGYGIHIDRTAAFFQALLKPLPGLSDWFLIDSDEVDDFYNDGCAVMVRATVNVPLTMSSHQNPPLSVRLADGRSCYPVEKFTGTWTYDSVALAVELGAEVVKIHVACAAERSPWLEPFAEFLLTIPKVTRKALYTRLWGKMCSQGGWVGGLDAPNCEHRATKYGDRVLYWIHKGRNWTDLIVPPRYKPDTAAFIVSDNHCSMIRSMSKLAHGTIVGTHVDAIWTEDIAGGVALMSEGGWSDKGRGQIRMWGQGRYKVCDKSGTYYGMSGVTHKMTPEQFEVWASKASAYKPVRGWDVKPRKDSKAMSMPPAGDNMRQLESAPMPDQPLFGMGGYLRKSIRDTLNGEPPSMFDAMS